MSILKYVYFNSQVEYRTCCFYILLNNLVYVLYDYDITPEKYKKFKKIEYNKAKYSAIYENNCLSL